MVAEVKQVDEGAKQAVSHTLRFSGARALSTLYAAAQAAGNKEACRPVLEVVRLTPAVGGGVQVVGCDTYRLLIADLDGEVSTWEGADSELLIPRGAILKALGAEARRRKGRALLVEVLEGGEVGLCSYAVDGGGGPGGRCHWWRGEDLDSDDHLLREGQYPNLEMVIPRREECINGCSVDLDLDLYMEGLAPFVAVYDAGGGCGRVAHSLTRSVGDEGESIWSLSLQAGGADISEVVAGVDLRVSLGAVAVAEYPFGDKLEWAVDCRLPHEVFASLVQGLTEEDSASLWHSGEVLGPFVYDLHDEGSTREQVWARLVVMPMHMTG